MRVRFLSLLPIDKVNIENVMKQTKLYKFFDQVRQEAKKVVWPERKELVTSVLIVIVAVCLFSLVSLILDYGIHNIVKFLLNIGK